MRRKAEKLIKDLEELIQEALYKQGKEDLFSKIEQLKTVDSSIEQLEDKDILVPDDLRRLKSQLLAETGQYEETYKVIEYLSTELRRIEKELRKVHFTGKKGSKKADRKT